MRVATLPPVLLLLVLGMAGNVKRLPSFTRVLLLEQSAETSANVSIGDLNGDGFPDLVLAKGRHWPLIDRVLLNDGHGRFPVAHNLGEVADRLFCRRCKLIQRRLWR